jgi:hypothetical protein
MGALSSLKKAKPLVSKFDEALEKLARPKGTGNEFLTEVMKQPGVKKAEIEDRKLKQAFEKAGKITKEQAQEIAKKHASPKIEETILTEQGEKFDELEKMAERDYGEAFEDLHPDIQDEIEKEFDAAATKYGEYRMPGGSNYREIIMKLPTMSEAEQARMMTLEAQRRRLPQGGQWVFDTDPEGKELKALKQKAEQSAYYSSHWGAEEPNPLAHMRVQDRVGPNGEKILHVEEIQSDWHQAGRKQGYKLSPEETAPMDSEYRALVHKNSDARAAGLEPDPKDVERAKQLEDALVKADSSKIPDAPFKKNWHELAMKRLINHAAENGYDKIAITPGAEQASRYDLSKQISKVEYDPNEQRLLAYDKNGRTVINERGVEPHQLDEYIGKDPAEKLRREADNATSALNEYEISRDPESGQYGIYLYGEPSYEYGGEQLLFNSKSEARDHLRSMVDEGISSNPPSISGLDLQVGGEGMKGFYDKMLPDYLNTLGKRHGTSVKPFEVEIPTSNEDATEVVMQKVPLHSFDITPELREEITTKGLPLYQQIGLPLGTGVGSYEFNAPEPEYAAGGAVVYNTDPDMSDGGAIIPAAPFKRGGKVKITDNLDEMFMEVNNKKFQRK